jgi:chromosome segregation ATPase
MPVPEVPDHGLVNAARYAVAFARARWQRRRAVKLLRAEIDSDTAALDGVLLTLGREARAAGVTNRVLADENAAITAVEQRRDAIAGQGTEVLGRKADENTKFEDIERQRQATVSDAERVVADAQRDVTTYEAQRRSLRDKRKDLERRQKAYLQAAEARESDAERSPMGDARAELRRAAEGHRREAASLDPDRQDLERKLAAVERPLSSAQAKLEAAKAELDAAKRALADAREGHRHRLAELDAEHGRKLREHELAEAEIVRRMVTLGTLINLHRVDRPEFAELYQRVDRLRAAINARTTEIDRLTAERSAYDRPSLIRGCAVLGGVVVGLVAIIAIILAVA